MFIWIISIDPLQSAYTCESTVRIIVILEVTYSSECNEKKPTNKNQEKQWGKRKNQFTSTHLPIDIFLLRKKLTVKINMKYSFVEFIKSWKCTFLRMYRVWNDQLTSKIEWKYCITYTAINTNDFIVNF
jgi:hypothetical protein